MDPRGQSMGLGHLQEAVRQSLEVLQNTIYILDPLRRQADQGAPHVHDHGGLPVFQGMRWRLEPRPERWDLFGMDPWFLQ